MNYASRRRELIRMKGEGKSLREMGEKFGISHQRVAQILHPKQKPSRMGIKKLCAACKRRDFTTSIRLRIYCDGCSVRLNGIDGRGRTREMVRIRDNDSCRKCDKKWKIGTRKFDVHHIKDCGVRTRSYDSIKYVDEMITLCHKCHFGAHSHEKVLKRSRKGIPEETKKAILTLYKAGNSIDKVARLLGVGYPTALKYSKETL